MRPTVLLLACVIGTMVATQATFADDAIKEIESGKVALIAILKVKPGQEDRFMAAMKANVAASQKEPGVVVYRSYQSEKDPNLFINFEAYRDKAAFQAHLDSDHVKVVGKVNDEVLTEPVGITMLTPY